MGRHGSGLDGYFDGDTDVVIGDLPSLPNIGPIPDIQSCDSSIQVKPALRI